MDHNNTIYTLDGGAKAPTKVNVSTKVGVAGQIGMSLTTFFVTQPIMMNVTNTVFDLLQVWCAGVKDAGTVSGMFITKTGIFTTGAATATATAIAAPISAIVASSMLIAYILYRKLNKNYSKYYEIINIINSYTTLLTRISNQLTIVNIAKKHYGFQFMDNSSDITTLLLGLTSLFSKFISETQQNKILEAAKKRNTKDGSDHQFWRDCDFGPDHETDAQLQLTNTKFTKKMSNWWNGTSIQFMFTNIRALGLNKDEWLETFNKMLLQLTSAYSVYMHEYENILQTHRAILNSPECDAEYGHKVAASKSFQCITLMGIFHPLIMFREKFLACMMSTSSPECKSINETNVDVGIDKTTKGRRQRFAEYVFLRAPELNHGNMNQHFSNALATVMNSVKQFKDSGTDQKCRGNKIYSENFKEYVGSIAGVLETISRNFDTTKRSNEVRVSTYAAISNSIYILMSTCSGISGSFSQLPIDYIFGTQEITDLFQKIQAERDRMGGSELESADPPSVVITDTEREIISNSPVRLLSSKLLQVMQTMQSLINYDSSVISCENPETYGQIGILGWLFCSSKFSSILTDGIEAELNRIGRPLIVLLLDTFKSLLEQCNELFHLLSTGKQIFGKLLYGLHILYQLIFFFLGDDSEFNRDGKMNAHGNAMFKLLFTLSQSGIANSLTSKIYIDNMLDPDTISRNLKSIISKKQLASKSSPKERSSPGEYKAMDPLFEYLNIEEVDNILSSFRSEWNPADRHTGELTIKWMTGLANYAFAVVNFYRCSESSSQISKVTKCVGFMQSIDIDSIEFEFASKCKSNRLFLDFKPREYIDLLLGHGFYTTMHDEQIRFPDIRDRASAAAAKALSPAAAKALSPAAANALSPAAANALSPAASNALSSPAHENGISPQIPTVNMDQFFPQQVPILPPPPTDQQPLQSRRRRSEAQITAAQTTAAQTTAAQPDIGAGVAVSNRRMSARIAAAADDAGAANSNPRRLDGGNKTRKMFIHKNKNQSMLRKQQTTNRFRLHRNKHSQRRNK